MMTPKQLKFLDELATLLEQHNAEIGIGSIDDGCRFQLCLSFYIPYEGDLVLPDWIGFENVRELCDSSRLADTRPSETKQG
jgi:hypothetical protein